MQGIVDGLAHSILSLAVSGTHDGDAAVFQDCFHIVEVEVDGTAHRNDFGDILRCD